MSSRKKRKHILIPNVNLKLLYVENHIWSHRFRFWSKYRVLKPRLPIDVDRTTRLVDNPKLCPSDFNTFIGKHNAACFKFLSDTCYGFENHHNLPEVLTLSGANGTGKSAIMRILKQKLVDICNFNKKQADKWVLFVNAREYVTDLNNLWTKIKDFASPPLEKYFPAKYRLVMIDDFDRIPPSSQQFLKKIMEQFAAGLRYIFACLDPRKCMTGFILNRSVHAKTRVANEIDCLQIVLGICRQNRIGYNIDGIHALMKLNPDRSLSKIIDMLQEVFVSKLYISKENVMRNANVPIELPTVPIVRALEPLDRCSICTLIPPCQHIPIEELNRRAVERRSQLPRHKGGVMRCPEFVRYGYCSLYNKIGRCSLDHPKNVHIVSKPKVRCPQCTIEWPCLHCDYTASREKTLATIAEIQKRLSRIRQINVPEPPLSLTRHLDESIINWKEKLIVLAERQVVPENLAKLESTIQWVSTSYCISKAEYEEKERKLFYAFADMLHSAILVDPSPVRDHSIEPAVNKDVLDQQQDSTTFSNIFTGIVGGGSTGLHDLLPLRTEVELQLDYDPNLILPDHLLLAPWHKDLMKQRATSIGRESVQTSLKSIQRLMLQMDRSDGRPDLPSGLLASKHYDFVSTCLRSKGGAWTAVLGPMEYVGLRVADHVVDREVGGQVIRIVKVASLCAAMSACLLDLDLKEADSSNRALKLSSDNVANILDLGLALTRVAIRYAILKEDLTSHEIVSRSSEEGGAAVEYFSSLELCTKTDDLILSTAQGSRGNYEEIIFPSSRRLHSILRYDLRIPEDDMPIKGASRIIVPKFLLKPWIEANGLSPPQQI